MKKYKPNNQEISTPLMIFLSSNKIYSIEKLLTFSDRFISTLKRFDKSIAKEIRQIRIQSKFLKENEYLVKKEIQQLSSQESCRLVDRSLLVSNERSTTETGRNQLKLEELNLSVRLYNIMIREGFTSKPMEFLILADEELMSMRNFGKKCLREVHYLQEMLSDEETLEKIRSSQAAKQSDSVQRLMLKRINIPEEIENVELKYILRFIARLDGDAYRQLKRILNRFKRFGNLDGMTGNELLKVEGIGRTTMRQFLRWLKDFQFGSFEELVEIIESNDVSINQIDCSENTYRFLEKENINCIGELSGLDELSHTNLTLDDALALLELRTLSIDEESGQFLTGANAKHNTSIVGWIEEFLQKHLKANERKIALDRWNSEAGEKTLEEVASINGITRERVRQVVEKIRDQFGKLYVSEEDEWALANFRDLIMKNLSAIRYDDIIRDDNVKPAFHENLYIGFLSHVFECVPFIKRRFGYIPSRLGYTNVGSKYWNLENELYEMALFPNLVNLLHFLYEKDIKSQLQYLKAIFISKSLTITKQEQNVYVNRTSYGLIVMLRQCMREYDNPVKLEEFFEFLSSNPFYIGKSRHYYTKQFGRKGKSSVYATLNRVDSFIRLDRYVWGLEKHIGYPRKQWRKIGKACRDVLRKLGHQASAAYLFESIRNQFPDLKSKYELNHILKRDPYLNYLGFMTFDLKRSGQKERKLVKDIVLEIFKKDPKPNHVDEIYAEIAEVRTFQEHGKYSIISKINGITYYRPSHFGLTSLHKENLRYLSNDKGFLAGFISYLYPHTSLDNIMEELEVNEPPDSYLLFLKKIKSIQFFEINQQIFFVDKNWSNTKKVVTILAHSGNAIFLEELVIILKTDLKIKRINRYTLRDRLKNDRHVRLLKNGKYKYVDIVDHIEKYQPLLDEIEDYLLQQRELVDVADLYKILCEYSEHEKPSDPEELLSLLEFDKRIKVLADGLVGIL